MAMKRKTTIH